MKLKTERLTNKEETELLNDLMMCEVLVMGFQEYLKSIGKFDEGQQFVREFMATFSNKDFKEKVKEELR